MDDESLNAGTATAPYPTQTGSGLKGYLGEIEFYISDQTVMTLSNWKWSGSARYGVQNRHNKDSITEFTGLDPDKITFDITLSADMNVRPIKQLERIWEYEREGVTLPLTIGHRPYGKYRWNIISHDATITLTDRYGDPQVVVVSLTLQEYIPIWP